MVLLPVCRPCCGDGSVVKKGKTEQGKQRYLCLNGECPKGTFILDYSYNGLLPDVKVRIIDMALNGSGIRDTARVLRVSPNTVIDELKKKESCLEPVNRKLLEALDPDGVVVDIQRVEDAELDEMWSYVRHKGNQRWLWHAIGHATGKVLAYAFGDRKDAVFLELKELLEPFGITRFYTDGQGAYERHLPSEQHVAGKRASMPFATAKPTKAFPWRITC